MGCVWSHIWTGPHQHWPTSLASLFVLSLPNDVTSSLALVLTCLSWGRKMTLFLAGFSARPIVPSSFYSQILSTSLTNEPASCPVTHSALMWLGPISHSMHTTQRTFKMESQMDEDAASCGAALYMCIWVHSTIPSYSHGKHVQQWVWPTLLLAAMVQSYTLWLHNLYMDYFHE